MREEEQRPKDVAFPGLLYARDPSLGPQLVWKGKLVKEAAKEAVQASFL